MIYWLVSQYSLELYVFNKVRRVNQKFGVFLLCTSVVRILKDLNIYLNSPSNFIFALDEFNIIIFLNLSIISISSLILFLAGKNAPSALLTSMPAFEFKAMRFLTLPLCKQLLLLSCVFALIGSLSGFGILNWILFPRLGYSEFRSGIGIFYALYLSLIGFAAVSNIYQNHLLSTKLFASVFVISLFAYLSGNKSIVFDVVMLTGLFLFLFRSRSLIVLTGKVTTIFILYFCFQKILLFSLPGYFSISQDYFDHIINSRYVYDLGIEDRFSLVDYISGMIIEAIPRVIWNDKPYFFGDGLLSEVIYSSDPGKNFGFVSTLWATVSGGGIAVMMEALFKAVPFYLLGAYCRACRMLSEGALSRSPVKLSSLFQLLILVYFTISFVPNVFGISGAGAIKSILAVLIIVLIVFIGGVRAHTSHG